ncbi:hypothetical protein EJB05_48392, partial [Eragrostis curvula]
MRPRWRLPPQHHSRSLRRLFQDPLPLRQVRLPDLRHLPRGRRSPARVRVGAVQVPGALRRLAADARLVYHLSAAPHSWPVDKISYRTTKNIHLSASQPQRLLVAEEDGRVFVLSMCELGSSNRGASVVCVRANDAAAGPHYTCTMWATGHKSALSGREELAVVQMAEVPSISASGEATAEEAVRLLVKNKDLHGASMVMRLAIRIEKVKA